MCYNVMDFKNIMLNERKQMEKITCGMLEKVNL